MADPHVLLARLPKVYLLNIDSFSENASREQAAVFAAACSERTSGILFWTVSADGRSSDLERYVETLDMLWSPDFGDPERYASQRRDLERMYEMRVGDELVGAPALALYTVVVFHSALNVVATGSADAILECSMAARNGAFRVQRRLKLDLLPAEERMQDEDIASLVAGSPTQAIQQRAQEHGRDRFEIIYAKYSAG